eukprot:5370028-Alexandrium_andersonii.AAC.1
MVREPRRGPRRAQGTPLSTLRITACGRTRTSLWTSTPSPRATACGSAERGPSRSDVSHRRA